MIGSSFWVIIIVTGVTLVAFGNIKYNQTREEENKLELAKNANSLLLPEVERNFIILEQMKEHIANDSLKILPFHTAAWETVSSGGLLLGYDSHTHIKYMELYRYIYRANYVHSRLSDIILGPHP